jgi:hypothetical protein
MYLELTVTPSGWMAPVMNRWLTSLPSRSARPIVPVALLAHVPARGRRGVPLAGPPTGRRPMRRRELAARRRDMHRESLDTDSLAEALENQVAAIEEVLATLLWLVSS